MGRIDKDFIELIDDDAFITAISIRDVDTVLSQVEKLLSRYSQMASLSLYDIKTIDQYLSAILSEVFNSSNLSQYADKLGVLGYVYVAGVLGIKELTLGTFTGAGSMFGVLFEGLESSVIAEKYKLQKLILQDSNIMDLEAPAVEFACEDLIIQGRYGTKGAVGNNLLDIKADRTTIDTKDIAKSSERSIAAKDVIFTENAGVMTKGKYLDFTKAFKVLSGFSDLEAVYLPEVEAVYISGHDYHFFDDSGNLTFYAPKDVKIFSNDNLPIKRI